MNRRTTTLDRKISATCVALPSSAVSRLTNQSVVSVRKVKEGPSAGFLSVDVKTESGLRGAHFVDVLMTYERPSYILTMKGIRSGAH